MIVAVVLTVALIVVMARCAWSVLHLAVVDRDRFGAIAIGAASVLLATGGLLVLTNIGAWSR